MYNKCLKCNRSISDDRILCNKCEKDALDMLIHTYTMPQTILHTGANRSNRFSSRYVALSILFISITLASMAFKNDDILYFYLIGVAMELIYKFPLRNKK